VQGEEGSDIDLLVLLKNVDNFWEKVRRLSGIAYEVFEKLDYQALFSVISGTEDEFESMVTPLF
jgi:predicted nucleotidyltransferase